jgi:hypothetical protein
MVALAQVVLALVGFDAQTRLYYSNAVMFSSSSLAAIICAVSALALPKSSPLRKGWLMIAAGIASWAIGQAVFFSYPLVNGGADTPYPYFSDIGYLLATPLIAIGLLVFHRSADLTAPLWGKVLAVVLFLAVGYWCYGANAEGIFTEGPALTAASIGYALTDPILLAVTVYVASSFKAGSAMSRAWWLVTTGVVVVLVGNQVYAYLVLIEVYATGSAIDASWPIGFGLMALSAFYTRESMR